MAGPGDHPPDQVTVTVEVMLHRSADVEKKEQVLVFVPRLRNRQLPTTRQATPEIDAAATRRARREP